MEEGAIVSSRENRPQEIRRILLEVIREQRIVPRALLLKVVAESFGEQYNSRRLRADVSRAIRALIEDGYLVDGGPELWPAADAPPEENNG